MSSQQEFIADRRSYYSSVFERSVTTLYQYLSVLNTGGVALGLTALEHSDSTWLKASIIAFGIGSLSCAASLTWDFYCARQNMRTFTAHASKYYASSEVEKQKAFDDLYDNEVNQSKLRWFDYVISGLPAAAFIVGLGIGLFVVSEWKILPDAKETVVKIAEPVPIRIQK